MNGSSALRRALAWGLVCVGVLLPAQEARAYTIASGFTASCHEEISYPALALYLQGISEGQDIPLPDDDEWKAASGDLRALFESEESLAPYLEDDRNLFVAYSLFAGLRFPDTNGYSVSDLNALRSVHGDSSPRGQYAHALRSSEDDGSGGDIRALDGVLDYVSDVLAEMQALLASPGQAQITKSFLYVEHYGRLELDVWGPAFQLGLALHALQDSFSHSIRSPDAAYVLHVVNFIDALSDNIDPEVDGITHSIGMDKCENPEVASLVEAAEGRSMAMAVAVLKWGEGDGGQAIQAGLSDCPEGDTSTGQVTGPECGWFAYYPQCKARIDAGEDLRGTCCSADTDFCDAEHLDLIESTPTRPYLKAACDSSGGASQHRGTQGGLVWGLFLLGTFVARRFRIRSVWLVGVVSALLVFMPREAGAQEHEPASPVLRFEGHSSLLTDAADESVINISYGPALRGGYRFKGNEVGQLGIFSLVERDSWLVHEFEMRVDPGVLNWGLGAEYLYYGFMRSSVAAGLSILVFDTGLHPEGNTGFFIEIQPLGLQFDLRTLGTFWAHWAVTLDPLGVVWLNPTPEWDKEPSLAHLQYRFTLGIEWRGVGRALTRPRGRM